MPPPPPLRAPALWAFPPCTHSPRATKRLHHAHFGGGSYPPSWWMSDPMPSLCHTSRPLYSPVASSTKQSLRRKYLLRRGGRSSRTKTKTQQLLPPQARLAKWSKVSPPQRTHRRGG